jgi:hypothetical protein
MFIGIYLECQNERIPHMRYVKTCCDVTYKLVDSFCKSCGKALVEFGMEDGTEDKICQRDVQHECDDIFSPVNLDYDLPADIFVGNREGLGNYYDIDEVTELTSSRQITPEDIKMATNVLMENDDLRNAYEVVKKHYGKNRVKVKYGVVIYYQ